MPEVFLLSVGPCRDQCLRSQLQGQGVAVRAFDFGEHALALLDRHAPDALILLHSDGQPPDDTIRLLALRAILQVRARSDVPILMLADLPSEDERLLAFNNGADEVITKSVSCRELAARVHVHIRRKLRCTDRIGAVLEAGPLSLDASRHRATMRGQALTLTPTEFRLLTVLAATPEMVLTREHLLTAVWGPRHATDTPYLRVYISSLRRKVETDPVHPQHLLTENGVGYVWMP